MLFIIFLKKSPFCKLILCFFVRYFQKGLREIFSLTRRLIKSVFGKPNTFLAITTKHTFFLYYIWTFASRFAGVFHQFFTEYFSDKFKTRYNIYSRELKITRKEPDCALTVGLSFYDIFSHSNKNSTSFYLRPNKNISKKIQVETELHPPKEIISAKAKINFF